MTSTFNSAGVLIDRYADVISRLITLAEEQWGASVQTDADSNLGHILRNMALITAELGEIIQDVYDARSVTAATGTALDDLLEILGIYRQSAAYSTVTLTLTATKATTVPAGSQYSTATGIVFATDEALVFTGAGTDTVDATCTVAGAYEAGIGEVTTIVTPVYGISASTNLAAATPGRDRETDAQLKARHTLAVSTSGDGDLASIYEAVTNVSGVSAAYIEDDTTTTSIHVVVIGGDDDDIADAIYGAKTAGIATTGSESVSVYDEIIAKSTTINFDRGAAVPIHIELTLTKLTNYPLDGDTQIKTALAALIADKRIGDDVIYTELYSAIYSVPGHYVTALKVDTVDPPTGTSTITISTTQRATLATTDIDIV